MAPARRNPKKSSPGTTALGSKCIANRSPTVDFPEPGGPVTTMTRPMGSSWPKIRNRCGEDPRGQGSERTRVARGILRRPDPGCLQGPTTVTMPADPVAAAHAVCGGQCVPSRSFDMGVDDPSSSPYRFSISILFFDMPKEEAMPRLNTWLRWLPATAAFIFFAALCLAAALTVIALIPGSPITQALPASA